MPSKGSQGLSGIKFYFPLTSTDGAFFPLRTSGRGDIVPVAKIGREAEGGGERGNSARGEEKRDFSPKILERADDKRSSLTTFRFLGR